MWVWQLRPDNPCVAAILARSVAVTTVDFTQQLAEPSFVDFCHVVKLLQSGLLLHVATHAFMTTGAPQMSPLAPRLRLTPMTTAGNTLLASRVGAGTSATATQLVG